MNSRTIVLACLAAIVAFITGHRIGYTSGVRSGFRQGRVQTLLEEGYSFRNIVRQHGDLNPPIRAFDDE